MKKHTLQIPSFKLSYRWVIAVAGFLCLTVSPATLFADTVFNEAMRNSQDPLWSGVLVVSLVLFGGVIAFVAVPYMWEQSVGTRSLWQSVFRLERENQRLRRNEATRDNAARKHPALDQPKSTETIQPQICCYFPAISHRFRSDMNSILGHLQLMLRQDLTPDQEASVEIMYESAQNMMKSMGDVFDLARIQAGQFALQQKSFSPFEVVDLAGMSVGSAAREKNLEFMCYPDEDIRVTAKGDQDRIQQVLEALLLNAIRFTDHGTITLRNKLLKASATDVAVRFTIEDTGSMLADKDRRASLWGTADNHSKDQLNSDSSGLEEMLASHLLLLMGSSLEIQDRPNGGVRCSFDLTLPIEPNRKINPPVFSSLSGRRILLAEDNQEAASFTKLLLASWGAEVDYSGNLEDTLELLAKANREGTPYAVGLIDSQLNQMPSTMLSESVLAACADQRIPVILLSCRPDDNEATDEQEIAILEKPFTVDRLNRLILRMVSLEQSLPVNASSSISSTSDGAVRVLIVDDDRISRELASRVLQRAGYFVQSAKDGLQALELLEKGDYDLILMDLDMPQMDGFESTSKIRSSRELADLPIIALTANALQDNAEKCRQAGMNDYLTKPFQIDKLLKTLEQYLPKPQKSEQLLASKSDVK